MFRRQLAVDIDTSCLPLASARPSKPVAETRRISSLPAAVELGTMLEAALAAAYIMALSYCSLGRSHRRRDLKGLVAVEIHIENCLNGCRMLLVAAMLAPERCHRKSRLDSKSEDVRTQHRHLLD